MELMGTSSLMRVALETVPLWQGWFQHLRGIAERKGGLAALPLAAEGSIASSWKSYTLESATATSQKESSRT
eukprot:424209-Pyramimonas_sp.AAC.1